jgi:hypothetical protein
LLLQRFLSFGEESEEDEDPYYVDGKHENVREKMERVKSRERNRARDGGSKAEEERQHSESAGLYPKSVTWGYRTTALSGRACQ